jgi:phenylacetate-CoA ligase
MNLRYHRRRLADVAAAGRLSRTLAAGERAPHQRRAHDQQQRLRRLVRHAAGHSPWYRERLGRAEAVDDGPVELARLPVLDRTALMEHFDELVTDRRLRRDELLGWVAAMTRDRLYLDRYRVLLTSGSSGRPGLFVCDASGWRANVAQFLRATTWWGLRPRLPRRRLAIVSGAAPTHSSRQGAATLAVGLHHVLGLPITLPVPELVEALNRFQPEYLNAYPSMALLLAQEQQAGRLRLSLDILSTSSELCTPETAGRLADAFGVRPFNLYATTEGLWGSDCEHHQGIHLFDDTMMVENVDADGLPVPPGQPGARLLVTNLRNLVLPLIRLEVLDVVTLDPDPCPCGRTLARARTIHGRDDDVLALPGRDGGRVAVHPVHFGLLAQDREVREFQVVQDGPLLRVLVVPGQAAGDGLETRLQRAVVERLAELGVQDPDVAIERRRELSRSAGGKLRLVVADT